MVTALVLLEVEKSKINSVAEALAQLDGVHEVLSVAGRYDIAVIIKVKAHEDVADLVTDKMLQVNGIVHSETLISFRVYSRHDRDGIFTIGLEGE